MSCKPNSQRILFGGIGLQNFTEKLTKKIQSLGAPVPQPPSISKSIPPCHMAAYPPTYSRMNWIRIYYRFAKRRHTAAAPENYKNLFKYLPLRTP